MTTSGNPPAPEVAPILRPGADCRFAQGGHLAVEVHRDPAWPIWATRSHAESRAWTSNDGSTSGYNGFSEGQIRKVYEAIQTALKSLPRVGVSEAPSEDVPVRFKVSEMAQQLEFLAATSSQAGQFTENLILRIQTMLADRRLGPIVAPDAEEERTLDTWLTDLVGADQANAREIASIDPGRWRMNNDSGYAFFRADRVHQTGTNLEAAKELLASTGTDTSKIVTANQFGADAPRVR